MVRPRQGHLEQTAPESLREGGRGNGLDATGDAVSTPDGLTPDPGFFPLPFGRSRGAWLPQDDDGAGTPEAHGRHSQEGELMLRRRFPIRVAVVFLAGLLGFAAAT